QVDAAKVQRDRQILEGLQAGRLDRALFSENANSYFTPQAIQDFASGLAPLGGIEEFRQTERQQRGGMSFRLYQIRFAKKPVILTVRELPDGKIEQFQAFAGD